MEDEPIFVAFSQYLNDNDTTYSTKVHFLNSVFSVYEKKVLQLMSGSASLEFFGEKDLVS